MVGIVNNRLVFGKHEIGVSACHVEGFELACSRKHAHADFFKRRVRSKGHFGKTRAAVERAVAYFRNRARKVDFGQSRTAVESHCGNFALRNGNTCYRSIPEHSLAHSRVDAHLDRGQRAASAEHVGTCRRKIRNVCCLDCRTALKHTVAQPAHGAEINVCQVLAVHERSVENRVDGRAAFAGAYIDFRKQETIPECIFAYGSKSFRLACRLVLGQYNLFEVFAIFKCTLAYTAHALRNNHLLN